MKIISALDTIFHVIHVKFYLPCLLEPFCLLVPKITYRTSECMGKTFQAATTNTWELFDHRSFLQNVFLISAKLNFHRPLVCSTICHVQYYTPEVGGSSVWQISKKYFAGVFYGQKALMCQLWQLETSTPYIHYQEGVPAESSTEDSCEFVGGITQLLRKLSKHVST